MARAARVRETLERKQTRALHPGSGVYTAAPRVVEDSWAAFATHDAKNMLGVLSSNIEWMRESVESGGTRPGELLEAIDDLRACAKRLTELMHEALQPKAEAPLRLTLSPVNVGAVLQSVYHQTRRQAQSEDVRVEVRIVTDAVAMLDRSLLERVLLNLVDNALRFAPRGSAVTVQCEVVEDRLHLSVTDQGPGIDKLQTERIFEPFFTTNAGAFPGEPVHAGLGLAFCRAVARAHGGDVRVRTPEVGTGASFVVELPLGA